MTDSKTIESRVTRATVYLSGAQVTRVASVSAASGTVALAGLPAGLRPDSIQVAVEQPASVVSVRHFVRYEGADRADELTLKLEQLRRAREDERDAIARGEAEQGFLAANMSLGGKQTGLKADDLRAGLALFNERTAAVHEARLASERRIEQLDRDIEKLEARLGGWDGEQPLVGQIEVVLAPVELVKTKVALRVSYFTDDAGWTPSYDARVREVGDDIELHTKAHITQTTGEDWSGVALTLSTGDPQVSAVCPELQPWYVDVPRAVPAPMAMRAAASADMMMADAKLASLEMAMPTFGLASGLSAGATSSAVSVEYELDVPVDVASGRDGQDVEVVVKKVPATYRIVTVPKLTSSAYLVAGVTGWQGLNLVPGEASVFSGEAYVGQTFIDPAEGKDALDVSLGRDLGVTVKRTRGRDFAAKTILGSNVRQTRQWELAVANLKDRPIDVELIDQVPVSVNKQVTVDVDAPGAERDADTGRLTWRFTLAPGERKVVTFKYIVTSPQDVDLWLE